jgi:hypothetical protein
MLAKGVCVRVSRVLTHMASAWSVRVDSGLAWPTTRVGVLLGQWASGHEACVAYAAPLPAAAQMTAEEAVAQMLDMLPGGVDVLGVVVVSGSSGSDVPTAEAIKVTSLHRDRRILWQSSSTTDSWGMMVVVHVSVMHASM